MGTPNDQDSHKVYSFQVHWTVASTEHYQFIPESCGGFNIKIREKFIYNISLTRIKMNFK